MSYPMQDELRSVLDRTAIEGDRLAPTPETYEAAERVLLNLIKTHGFTTSQAYEIVRTVYWAGWNSGWDRGYTNRP